MKRRARILHILQNLNYGGMEKLLADLVCQIDRDRFEMHVLTLEYRGRYSKEMEGLAEVHLGPRMSRASIVRPAALAAALRSIGPDIVHTHSGVWPKGSRAARMAGARGVVHTEHGKQSDRWLSRFFDRRAARRTDAVISVSQPLREYLVERLGSAVKDRIIVVRNGVDTDRFRPGRAAAASEPSSTWLRASRLSGVSGDSSRSRVTRS